MRRTPHQDGAPRASERALVNRKFTFFLRDYLWPLGGLAAALGAPLVVGAVAPPLRADVVPQLQPAFYAELGAGARAVSDQESSPYFSFDPAGSAFYRDYRTTVLCPSFALDLGCQLWSAFSLELGGSYSTLALASPDAGGSWNAYGFDVMPALRFCLPGVRVGHPAYQTFGVRVGELFLDGGSGYIGSGGVPADGVWPTGLDLGSSNETGQASDLGLVYRIQDMRGDWFDLGLEFSYDFINVSQLNGHPGTVVNPYGAPLKLNLSGVSVRVLLGTWFGSPFPSGGGEAVPVPGGGNPAPAPAPEPSRSVHVTE